MEQAVVYWGVRLMRTLGMSLGVCIATAAVAAAQGPGAQPPAGTATGRVPTPGADQGTATPVALQPPDPKVVAHFKAWEAKMAGLENLYTTCEVTREEILLRKKKQYTGSVVVMKPNLARMRIVAANDPNDYEAYLCDGKSVFVYEGLRKVLTQHVIPAGAAGPAGGTVGAAVAVAAARAVGAGR